MSRPDKKINVLFVSHTSDIGGAERCLLNILKYIDRTRFKPLVVLPQDGPLNKEIEETDTTIYKCPIDWWIPPIAYRGEHHWGQITTNLFTQVSAILKIIENERIDVLHTNTSVIWAGAIAAKIAGIPHLWHLHEILDEHPSLKPYYNLQMVYSLINFCSDRIVVVSKSLEEKLIGYVSSEKVVTIPNGIDIGKFQSPSYIGIGGIRDELGLKDNDLLIGTVGNIVREKGYDILIEAAQILRNKIDKVNFIIVGSDENKDVTNHLKNMVVERRLTGLFHFLGYRNDIPLILKDIDLYVNSSLTEVYPLSVMEAMAAGKPVVATRCGGISDVVVDGETGYLVDPSNPRQLANSMYRLLTNRELMTSFGNAGAKRAQKYFDVRNYVPMLEREYELLAQKQTGPGASQPDAILRIIADVFNAIEKELSDQSEQIRVQQQQIHDLNNFVQGVKRTKIYRFSKWILNLWRSITRRSTSQD